MDGFVDNLRAGLRLACGMPVEPSGFRIGRIQLVALAFFVVALVAVLRALAAPMPGGEADGGAGPLALLAVGGLGCLYLADRIQKARIRIEALLVLVLSSEIAALTIAGAARQVAIRFPSDYAAEALSVLPWIVLAWMVLIVVRAVAILAAAASR